MVGTQSISSLRSTLPGESWRTLLQGLRTKVFLTLSDDFSAQMAADLCGKTERLKPGYTISEAGRLAFSGWISREPGPELIRFPLLLTIFFGEHVEPSRLDRFLRIHRLEHERRLEQYRQFDEALAGTSTSRRNTVRFGILYEEAVLAWFDSLPKLDEVTRVGSAKGRRAARMKPNRRSKGSRRP